MQEKSFYDLDYIIDINEKRLEQYTEAYHKSFGRLTHIIIIYTAISIYLVPIIQNLIFAEVRHWCYQLCFVLFAVPFFVSLIYTIKFLIPIEVAYLYAPKIYYDKYREDYENMAISMEDVNMSLKAVYIEELEEAIRKNYTLFKRKRLFFYRAFVAGLLSILPFLICLGIHIGKKEYKIPKVQIVNSQKIP